MKEHIYVYNTLLLSTIHGVIYTSLPVVKKVLTY